MGFKNFNARRQDRDNFARGPLPLVGIAPHVGASHEKAGFPIARFKRAGNSFLEGWRNLIFGLRTSPKHRVSPRP